MTVDSWTEAKGYLVSERYKHRRTCISKADAILSPGVHLGYNFSKKMVQPK